MDCPHAECYTVPRDNGLHVHWCTQCGAMRTRGKAWRYPSSGRDAKTTGECGGCKSITHAMEANVATQAKEMLKLAALGKQVAEMQRDFDVYRKRVVRHETVLMDFYKSIAQHLG